MVLVDTSVWIHFFRAKTADKVTGILETLLVENKAALCGIVELELLHGLRPHEQKKIEPLLSALPFLETTRETYQLAGKMLQNLREKGKTIPATDSLIAATAIQNHCSIMTLDTHFDHFPIKNVISHQ